MAGDDRVPIHPDEALALVLADLPPPAVEEVPLREAASRVLVRPLPALLDQPPFDKSAMDGYAYAEEPPPGGRLRLVETVAAGRAAPRALEAGECSLVMTGAPIPPGARGVHRREFAEEEGGLVAFVRKEDGDNVIRRGENQKAGDLLLPAGPLSSRRVGILASSGYASVSAARRPVVGVVSTGDELVPAGAALPPGAIFDSNGPQLLAQAAEAGCLPRAYGIAVDEAGRLREVLGRALDECDVVLVSGAVSLGDFDHVPEVLAGLGVEKVFHGLKMRPGKPTFYGRRGAASVFGLPGNPVSALVNFIVLVRPHLMARMGAEDPGLVLRLPLASRLSRRGADRVEYLPAVVDNGGGAARVRPVRYRGSSMLAAYAEADCVVRMDLGVERMEEGEVAHARLL